MTKRNKKVLPDCGTLLDIRIDGRWQRGKVLRYEHHSARQVTFPVQVGNNSMTTTADQVRILPENVQPGDRYAPPPTGVHAAH